MNKTIWQLVVTFVLTGVSLGQAQSAPVHTSTGLVPSDRAKAIFEDIRVKNFLSLAKDSFGVTCAVPDFEKVTATITQKGPLAGVPDSIDLVYEFPVTCSGGSTINIKTEFAPPLDTPLDMTVTSVLHSKK